MIDTKYEFGKPASYLSPTELEHALLWRNKVLRAMEFIGHDCPSILQPLLEDTRVSL